MGVMGRVGHEPGGPQPLAQDPQTVYADVAAGRALWYSSDSAQVSSSGHHLGTVTARVPPGLSTRASSAMADRSSGMCSRASQAASERGRRTRTGTAAEGRLR